jgi:hypothetical protein
MGETPFSLAFAPRDTDLAPDDHSVQIPISTCTVSEIDQFRVEEDGASSEIRIAPREAERDGEVLSVFDRLELTFAYVLRVDRPTTLLSHNNLIELFKVVIGGPWLGGTIHARAESELGITITRSRSLTHPLSASTAAGLGAREGVAVASGATHT